MYSSLARTEKREERGAGVNRPADSRAAVSGCLDFQEALGAYSIPRYRMPVTLLRVCFCISHVKQNALKCI